MKARYVLLILMIAFAAASGMAALTTIRQLRSETSLTPAWRSSDAAADIALRRASEIHERRHLVD